MNATAKHRMKEAEKTSTDVFNEGMEFDTAILNAASCLSRNDLDEARRFITEARTRAEILRGKLDGALWEIGQALDAAGADAP